MCCSRGNFLTKTFSLLVAASVLFTVAQPSSLMHAETTADATETVQPVVPHKGMCYVTWDKDRFATEYSDKALAKLADIGVRYVSICVTQYQEKYNSTKIKPTDKTPSIRSTKHAIKTAHKQGLKVMLKPHIDLIDAHDGTYWRADIGFATEENWKKWFRSYEKFIVKYARIADRHDVDIFCVGTELAFTTQKENEWRKLIQEVRKVFKGKIVYAANWDNYKNIGFWDDLDYVGIDAYFPLSYRPNPSLDELKDGWSKWIYEIEVWQKSINKPVLFTELGYASTKHAPYTPWKGGVMGNPDPDIQARCYKAFFETVWKKPWFAGVYWWKWDTNVRAGGKHNRQFTPQNKPAQEVIEEHYKK